MQKLLEHLGYTPPNLKPYNNDGCKVDYIPKIRTYRMYVNGTEWMSYGTESCDQAYEVFSHWDQAQGHCICTGLGFGIRENWILNKPGVTKVTVIERNKQVIDYLRFINPQFFDHVEVINTDVYEYKGKCDTLLLDHYEDEAANDYLLLQNMSEILKNVECDRMWMWTLENIIAGRQYQRRQQLGTHVTKTLIYNELKNRFDLHKLPDLTEDVLDLYYFMYSAKAISSYKQFWQVVGNETFSG